MNQSHSHSNPLTGHFISLFICIRTVPLRDMHGLLFHKHLLTLYIYLTEKDSILKYSKIVNLVTICVLLVREDPIVIVRVLLLFRFLF